ncbi:DUF4190 domain-containing protein [Mycobacterium sp. Marseille-P9652]|uniref:DUF4190 domain-containing protein n=1 Tax=Mycobacterium sp. Marseille-P9652 TaxID=2654950 RepID=UPI0012E8FFC0|nr:DUF4190 domain-containing protein [Mycobacterium sp. Marseille-P9652]
MCTHQVTTHEVPTARTNALAIAAFVLSLMGMYASPAVSGVLAVVALRQAKHRQEGGFVLAIAALAVSLGFTALHVMLWIQWGRPNFELLTTAHW